MKVLNALQVSFLMDISKEAALYKILTITLGEKGREKVLSLPKFPEKSDFRDRVIDVEKLSKAEEIDFQSLIDSINADFTHSWECTQYLLKK